jgi:hypothetical protein
MEFAAMTQAEMSDFHRLDYPAQNDLLVAPVKLVGVARREGQGDIGAIA